jgi:hypothetical protein
MEKKEASDDVLKEFLRYQQLIQKATQNTLNPLLLVLDLDGTIVPTNSNWIQIFFFKFFSGA